MKSPTEDPDVQEAESLRYGNRLFMVLPLSSGRFAILNRAFEPKAIVADPDLIASAGIEVMQAYVPPAPPPRRELVSVPKFDLGL